MTKVNLYAPFIGVKDALTLLTLLRDKEKLEEVLGIVKVLDERIAEINQAIETYGKASQMDILLREAGQKKQEAKVVLTAAREEAEETTRAALAEIEAAEAADADRKTALAAGETALAEGQTRLKADVERQADEMADREAKVGKREDKAAADLAAAKDTKARYEGLIADIKESAAAA